MNYNATYNAILELHKELKAQLDKLAEANISGYTPIGPTLKALTATDTLLSYLSQQNVLHPEKTHPPLSSQSMDKKTYSYYLTVEATGDVQDAVHIALIKADLIGKYLYAEPRLAHGANRKRYYSDIPGDNFDKLPEVEADELFYSLAQKYPDAVFEFSEYVDSDQASSAVKKRFMGDLYQDWALDPASQTFISLRDGKDILYAELLSSNK